MIEKNEKKGKGEQKFAAAAAAAAAAMILDNMLDGVSVVDAMGNLVQLNAPYAKILGFDSPKELIGKPIAEFTPERIVKQIAPVFKEVAEKGFLRNYETTVLHKSGREIPVMLNLTALKDSTGEMIGALATMRDITELKRLQEEAAKTKETTILEAMIDGVVGIDMKGNITKCNSAYAKMHGFKTPEEMQGINLSGLIAERDVQRTMNEVKRTYGVGITVNFEHTAKDKAGKEFPVLVNASVLKDEKGKIVGAIGVVRDITELKKAQEEAIKAVESEKKKAEQLERFNKVAVGRELAMRELKEKIEELEVKLKEKG